MEPSSLTLRELFDYVDGTLIMEEAESVAEQVVKKYHGEFACTE